MIRRTIGIAAGSLAAAGLLGGIILYSIDVNKNRDPETTQQVVSGLPVESGPASELETENYEYLLKTVDGRLAVFARGKAEPEMVFDVAVRTLPEYDQRQLETGIPVADYESLVKRIEDFIS